MSLLFRRRPLQRAGPSLFIVSLFLVSSRLAEAKKCESIFRSHSFEISSALKVELTRDAQIEELAKGGTGGASYKSVTTQRTWGRAGAVGNALAAESFGANLRTVLYLASGFDAGTAFRIFRQAETVIGVDANPFASPRAKRPKVSSFFQTDSDPWAVVSLVSSIGKAHGLAGSIVESIQQFAGRVDEAGVMIPIRIRRVVAFHTKERIPTLAIDAVHGLVEFDDGEGTPIRRYVHLNKSFYRTSFDAHDRSIPGWVTALTTIPFDALLIKAAMSIYPANVPADLVSTHLYSDLVSRNGVVVDCDGSSTDFGAKLAHLGGKAAQTRVLDVGNLGYDELTRLVKYK